MQLATPMQLADTTQLTDTTQLANKDEHNATGEPDMAGAKMNTAQLANQMHLVQLNTAAGKSTQVTQPKALATHSLRMSWVC